jgi:hypothetical protein
MCLKAVRRFGKVRVCAVLCLINLTGCAGIGSQATSGDYIEIANPAFTSSPNAAQTIWVPRSYLEKGAPRGGELARRGYDAVQGIEITINK